MNERWARLAAAVTMLTLMACARTPTPAATAVPTGLPAATIAAPATATLRATRPAPTSTPSAGSIGPASATALPTPPAGPLVRQLTTGGCCVQPFWSADSSQVRYIDRPSSGQPSGIWGVAVSGGPPVFVTARLGIYSPDDTLVAYPESGQTYIERLGDKRWPVANGGRAVIFSPDSRSLAWQAASSSVDFDTRTVVIWVANVDGTGEKKIATLIGGGLSGWFPDGQRLLVTSRADNATQVQALNVADSSLTLIASGPHIQGLSLSPLGGWVVYSIAFSGDSTLDGLWVAPTTGGTARRLADYGAFVWRAEGKLLLIPLEATASSNRLVEVAAESAAERPLTDPAVTPFQIADGNWSLSPDGLHLAFVSAADHNIWVMDLPK